MALITVNDWKAFSYALMFTMEKESGIRIVDDDVNHDVSVSSPHSSVVDSVVSVGLADPVDVRAFADLYTAWRQNVKDIRPSFSVAALPPYGLPPSVFNTTGSL